MPEVGARRALGAPEQGREEIVHAGLHDDAVAAPLPSGEPRARGVHHERHPDRDAVHEIRRRPAHLPGSPVKDRIDRRPEIQALRQLRASVEGDAHHHAVGLDDSAEIIGAHLGREARLRGVPDLGVPERRDTRHENEDRNGKRQRLERDCSAHLHRPAQAEAALEEHCREEIEEHDGREEEHHDDAGVEHQDKPGEEEDAELVVEDVAGRVVLEELEGSAAREEINEEVEGRPRRREVPAYDSDCRERYRKARPAVQRRHHAERAEEAPDAGKGREQRDDEVNPPRERDVHKEEAQGEGDERLPADYGPVVFHGMSAILSRILSICSRPESGPMTPSPRSTPKVRPASVSISTPWQATERQVSRSPG